MNLKTLYSKRSPYEYLNNYEAFKRDAIVAATELRYPEEVIEQVKKAETSNEITRIMKNARLREED